MQLHREYCCQNAVAPGALLRKAVAPGATSCKMQLHRESSLPKIRRTGNNVPKCRCTGRIRCTQNAVAPVIPKMQMHRECCCRKCRCTGSAPGRGAKLASLASFALAPFLPTRWAEPPRAATSAHLLLAVLLRCCCETTAIAWFSTRCRALCTMSVSLSRPARRRTKRHALEHRGARSRVLAGARSSRARRRPSGRMVDRNNGH